MKKTKFIIRQASLLLSLILLAAVVFSAVSCGCQRLDEPLSKQELYENVKTQTEERESVTRYIYEWGFPQFNTNKFLYIENHIKEHFYEEMPSDLIVATACAYNFLTYEYDKIDLTDSVEVTDALLRSYLGSSTEGASYLGAIGDRYASYRDPEEQKAFTEQISGGGTYVGIGIQIRNTEEGLPYINGVYKGSGAEAAGIKHGDVIIAVDGNDGRDTDSPYEFMANALAGEENTTVSVDVLRGDEVLSFSVVRKKLPAVSVYSRFDEETKFGYINIMTFQLTTGAEFKAAIDELEALGVRGVVFDLRNNLGGALDAVWECVSYLVEDGVPFISTTTHDKVLESGNTIADGHKLDIPMVVLMNEYTASAAELFASALKDYRDNAERFGISEKRVTAVGKQTYGKGIMQTSYTFTDGSLWTYTSAYYNPPGGVNYNGVGVLPDEGYETDPYFSISGDRQLNRAYEALSEYFLDAAA